MGRLVAILSLVVIATAPASPALADPGPTPPASAPASESPSPPASPSPTGPPASPSPTGAPRASEPPVDQPSPAPAQTATATVGDAAIALSVPDVTLGAPGTPGRLAIRLANTGYRAATGVLDVVVPDGVGIGTLPADCRTHRPLSATSLECGLGTVAPREVRTVTMPLLVDAKTRARAPLAGLVRGTLSPAGRPSVSTQSGYRILARPGSPSASARGRASTPAAVAAAAGTSGGRPASLGSRTARAWPLIAGSVLVLLLVTAGLVMALRRRTPARVPARPGPDRGPPPPDRPIAIEWSEVPPAGSVIDHPM